jgi:glycosyltransferase involved in cell wall biosynthesis
MSPDRPRVGLVSGKPRLVLSANAVPLQGGQGLNLWHMIEGLRGEFDLTVFCRGPAGIAPGPRVPDSWRTRLIGRLPVLRRLRDWQTWFSEVDFDRRVARSLPPADLFQAATGQGLESLRAARRHGCPTVLDVVTTHIDFFGEQMDRECARFGVRPSLSRSLRQRMREEYRQADLIRVMSHGARRTFLERGFPENRVFVATPPFAVEDFPQAEFRQPAFRVCFAGLIEPWKGFHYLIEAFNTLGRADSELVLWGGAGSRPVTNYLREQTGQNPRIQVRPVEIRQVGYGPVYGEASVLVHPSLSDGFGYVVGEAMACGLPVIVTSASGAADLVRDGVNGYVVPPGDAGAIRDRLDHLANNPALVRSMGAAARATVGMLTAEQFRASLVSALGTLVGAREESRCPN